MLFSPYYRQGSWNSGLEACPRSHSCQGAKAEVEVTFVWLKTSWFSISHAPPASEAFQKLPSLNHLTGSGENIFLLIGSQSIWILVLNTTLNGCVTLHNLLPFASLCFPFCLPQTNYVYSWNFKIYKIISSRSREKLCL